MAVSYDEGQTWYKSRTAARVERFYDVRWINGQSQVTEIIH